MRKTILVLVVLLALVTLLRVGARPSGTPASLRAAATEVDR